ncbi:hypothetical protein CQW23_20134 [Capsicum baccatum]|uniref:Ubiquitin-like protease family profile domain-containing protein n=1 Tax=Capsicum baccatum TaxID=33114 RepID=A0A2G2W7R8_CAPBA|nr:hypothetical protein CQW23_20134 [Capsicum baccatum]
MCRKGDMRYVDCIWIDEPPMGPTSGSFGSVGVYGDCTTIPEVVRQPRASSSSLSSLSYALNLLYCVYIVLYWLIDLSSMYLSYLPLLPKVSRNEECLINIIKGYNIPADLPWHLIDEVYIPINCGDEFHWALVVVVLKERRIRVYDSMSLRRRSGLSFKIQKLAKILPTYLDMSGFLDQKVRIDWSMIEACRDKMGNPFDVQYAEGITQQTIGSLCCVRFLLDEDNQGKGNLAPLENDQNYQNNDLNNQDKNC